VGDQIELEKNVGNKVSIAYTNLRKKIMNGSFEYGEILSANALSSELQMSRTPILEAFKLLEHEDLVAVIPQVGVIVKPINNDDISERYEALAVLEGLLAGLAAKNCTEVHEARIRNIIDEAEKYIISDDYNAFSVLNNLFHDTIREIANKPFIQNLCKDLRKSQTWHANWKELVYTKQNNMTSFEEHKECFEAIRKNDVLNARMLMEKHVLRTRNQFLEKLLIRENHR
jgi:DNA-binding GntR family transcriptional regulator